MSNNAINSDVQKRRFALHLPAGYGERQATKHHLMQLACKFLWNPASAL